ncbi:MAG: hypothetical protein HY812_07145 [Planctomycetes bacterium]|nr:hypothetical protein [Planctomycetota bacterium]
MRCEQRHFYGVYFLVLIGTPGLGFLLGWGGDQIENRRLVELPAFSWRGLMNSDYLQALNAYLNDHVPFRGKAVEVDARCDLRVFGDSPNPRVEIGRDGWLFLSETVFTPPWSREMRLEAARRVLKLQRIVENSGRTFVFLPAPNKEAIYPDKLARLGRREEFGEPLRREIRDLLFGAPDRARIDMWTILEEAKRTSDRFLYRPMDQHWTDGVSLLAAREIIASVRPGLWEEEAAKSAGVVRREGALSRMIGLPADDVQEEFVVCREGAQTTVLAERTPHGPSVIETRGERPLIEEEALFFHDSFLAPAKLKLAPYFRRSTFIHWRGFETLPQGGGEYLRRYLALFHVIVLQTFEAHMFHWLVENTPGMVEDFVAALFDDLDAREVEFALVDGWSGNGETRAPGTADGSGLVCRIPPLACREGAVDRYLVVDLRCATRVKVELVPIAAAAPARLVCPVPAGETQAVFDLEGVDVGGVLALLPGSAETLRIRLVELPHGQQGQ